MTIKRIDGEWVRVLREDGTEGRLALDRLLSVGESGAGLHYRFHGWRPLRRGYRTALVVAEVSERLCQVRLPEWDPEICIEQPLSILPDELREVGALGSCMADLSSRSTAALNIHSCRRQLPPRGSRPAAGPHPDFLAPGQRYRRRADDARFQLIDADGPRVRAWNGSRVVRLGRDRLLAASGDGTGASFEFLGGGVHHLRRARNAAGRGPTTEANQQP